MPRHSSLLTQKYLASTGNLVLSPDFSAQLSVCLIHVPGSALWCLSEAPGLGVVGILSKQDQRICKLLRRTPHLLIVHSMLMLMLNYK